MTTSKDVWKKWNLHKAFKNAEETDILHVDIYRIYDVSLFHNLARIEFIDTKKLSQ